MTDHSSEASYRLRSKLPFHQLTLIVDTGDLLDATGLLKPVYHASDEVTTLVGSQRSRLVPLVSRCVGLHQPPPPCAPPRDLRGLCADFRGSGRPTKEAKKSTVSLPAVRIESGGGGEAILPTLGWGKQSIWLAASGCQTPFCGQKPAPTFP